MKYLLILMLSFAAICVQAQIVNIPDPIFKEALLDHNPVIDTNNDGEIEVSEAEATTEISITFPVHDYTGLEAFSNLITLDIDPQNGWDFRPGHLPSLKRLYLGGPAMDAGYVDLTQCDSLGFLSIAGPPVTNENINIQTLNISGLTQLDSVILIEGYLGSFIATNCTGLKTIRSQLFIGSSVHDTLELTGCSNLLYVDISKTYVTSVDLSTCTAITDYYATSNNLQTLNVKNGTLLNHLDLNRGLPITTSYISVCADDFEINNVFFQIQNHFPNGSTPPVLNVNSYCSFFPVGNYNTITGAARYDMNNNGCDNADAGVFGIPVKITNSSGDFLIHYTANNGVYAHYCQAGNFTLSPYFPQPYFNISPSAPSNVDFPVANSLIQTKDFCVTANGTHNDLVITLLPLSRTRIGQSSYQLVYKNKGTAPVSGNVQVNFDGNKMSFLTGSGGINAQTPGQLSMNFNNLLPFESRTTQIIFQVFTQPFNNIGDTLFFLATIDPVANDETPVNNSFILPQRITGGLDPNDKECLQGSRLYLVDIDKPLDYIIRFQNLGNDTAFNIVVVDTISDKLDWSSLEITSTSHPCDIKLTNNKLECYFKDIHLPSAAENEPASHGFVAFKIKPRNTVVIGDSLNNKASIYFDFNLPVVTNIATTIVSPVSTVHVKLEYFSLVSKDETNQLVWKASSTNGITDFGIERSNDGIRFSNIGNITASMERCQSPFNFTDDKPFDGKTFYRLNIKDANGLSFYSKVLVAERNKIGFINCYCNCE